MASRNQMFKQFTKRMLLPVPILQPTRISSTEFYERIEHHSPEKSIQYIKLELPPLLQLSLEISECSYSQSLAIAVMSESERKG